MKKIIVYVALMISSLVFSQNAFDKLEDKEGVESILFQSGIEEKEIKKLIKDLVI